MKKHDKQKQKDPYTRLARQAAELYLRQGWTMKTPADLEPELKDRRAGVFVTVANQGELRGCIGTVGPVRDNLAREIIENTIAAITSDSRFRPIGVEELADLDFEVSVLGELQPVKDKSELNPKRFGVYVKTPDSRAGLLLPDLPGVDSVEQQLEIACAKGGIAPTEDFSIQAFEVEKHE